MALPLPRRRSLLAAAVASGLAPARAEPATLLLAGEALPPYSFEAGGGSQGLHLALCEAALAPLGLRLQWQPMPWRRALADLEGGLIDGVIGATRGNLNEREVLMAFPDEPLSWTHNVFVSRRERSLVFDGLFTLRGLRVAVLNGYQYSPDFMAAAYFQRQSAANHGQSLRMLMAGRVDAALLDVASARYLIREQGLQASLHIDAAPIAPGRLYLGFSRQREQARWAEPFAAALRRFKRGPRFAPLLAQYGLGLADVMEPGA
jgi:polar amino acid transport system substrate-binding protein